MEAALLKPWSEWDNHGTVVWKTCQHAPIEIPAKAQREPQTMGEWWEELFEKG